MLRKQYIFIFTVFACFNAATLILFCLWLEKRLLPFLLASFIAFASGIVYIALNRKKLVVYEVSRIENKFKTLEFSVIEEPVRMLYEKLIKHGYVKTTENTFHKKVEYDGGVSHYFVSVFHENGIFDVQKFPFSKETAASYIGYIFLDGNVEDNLETLKQYIKDRFIHERAHVHKRKRYFAPIVIADQKIFYLKVGSFLDDYRHSLSEGLRILESRSRKKE